MDLKTILEKKIQALPPDKIQEIYSLTAELKKRQNENLCDKYIPNGKCEEFINLVGSNKCFINLFCAANGVGKTTVAVNILANICFGIQNEWFNQSLFQKFPYLKKGRIISDPTTIKEKIVPEIKKWFPSNRYKSRYTTLKNGKQYESHFETDTGFSFDLMSTEQDVKEFESVDLGFVLIDEPIPRSIFIATTARLRRGGIMVWTMTPLDYSAWIKDYIYDRRDGKYIDYVTADIEDNCKDHGVRGLLRHEDIDKMASQYPEAEREARLHGKFGHLLGLVHKGFEPKIHVIEPFATPKETHTVYFALDTHPRVPDAGLWLAVDQQNTKYVIAELNCDGTDIEVAERIKDRERNWYVRERYIDPSAYNDDKRSIGENYALRLESHGLIFKSGSKDLVGCIKRTDQAFSYQIRESTMVVPPELYIFSSCHNLIKELQNYVWDEYKGKTADEKDPKPHPKDINDHFVEDLHRLLYVNPRFYDTKLIKKVKNLRMRGLEPRKLPTYNQNKLSII